MWASGHWWGRAGLTLYRCPGEADTHTLLPPALFSADPPLGGSLAEHFTWTASSSLRHPFLSSGQPWAFLGKFFWGKEWGLFACRYVFGLPVLSSLLSFSSVTVHTGFTNIQTFSLLPVSSWRETDFKHPGKGCKKMDICLTERPDGSLLRLPTSFQNLKCKKEMY